MRSLEPWPSQMSPDRRPSTCLLSPRVISSMEPVRPSVRRRKRYYCVWLSSGHQDCPAGRAPRHRRIMVTPTMTKLLLPRTLLVALSLTALPIVDARRRAFASSSLASPISQHRSGQTKQRAASAFVESDVDVASTSATTNNSHATEVRGGGGGTATMSNEMFNMVKAVVGVGVLSLPAGEFLRWSSRGLATHRNCYNCR